MPDRNLPPYEMVLANMAMCVMAAKAGAGRDIERMTDDAMMIVRGLRLAALLTRRAPEYWAAIAVGQGEELTPDEVEMERRLGESFPAMAPLPERVRG